MSAILDRQLGPRHSPRVSAAVISDRYWLETNQRVLIGGAMMPVPVQ